MCSTCTRCLRDSQRTWIPWLHQMASFEDPSPADLNPPPPQTPQDSVLHAARKSTKSNEKYCLALCWHALTNHDRCACTCGHAHTRAVLNEGEKSVPQLQLCKKTACSSYIQPWFVAIGGWRLAVGGDWRLAVGGWWRLVAVGGGWWLAIGGLVGVGGWRLAAVGSGWRLAVGGWWRLGVGGRWYPGAVPGGGP